MSLNKITYVDEVTVIPAQNLNDIQDEILQNADDISELDGEVENLDYDINDSNNGLKHYVSALQRYKLDVSEFTAMQVGACFSFETSLYTIQNKRYNLETGELEVDNDYFAYPDLFHVSDKLTLVSNFHGHALFYAQQDDGTLEYDSYYDFGPGEEFSTDELIMKIDVEKETWPSDGRPILHNVSYMDEIVGDIGSVLDAISGEVI